MVERVDDAAEERHDQGPARLHKGGQLGGRLIADQINARCENQAVRGQIVGRAGEIGGDVGVEQVSVVRLQLRNVVDSNRWLRGQLERPPRIPVVEHRDLGGHPAAAHRVQAPELAAQLDDLVPRRRALWPAVRDHRAVEFLGAGA